MLPQTVISHGIDTFYVAQTKRHLQFGRYEMDLWLFEAAGHKPNQSVSRGHRHSLLCGQCSANVAM